MTLALRPEALRDLEDALGYVADRDWRAAEVLHASIFRAFDDLDAGGFDGPPFTLPSGERVRRFYAHPFWIYCQRLPGDTLLVLRVRHYARAPLA